MGSPKQKAAGTLTGAEWVSTYRFWAEKALPLYLASALRLEQGTCSDASKCVPQIMSGSFRT